MEEHGEDVVPTGQRQDHEEGQRRGPDPERTGASHGQLEQVVLSAVAGDAASMNGQRAKAPKTIVGTTIAGHEGLGIVTPRIVGSKLGPEPQEALEPAEVPVGLRGRADRIRG